MQITESLKGNLSANIYENGFAFGLSYSSLNVRNYYYYYFFFREEGIAKPWRNISD